MKALPARVLAACEHKKTFIAGAHPQYIYRKIPLNYIQFSGQCLNKTLSVSRSIPHLNIYFEMSFFISACGNYTKLYDRFHGVWTVHIQPLA